MRGAPAKGHFSLAGDLSVWQEAPAAPYLVDADLRLEL